MGTPCVMPKYLHLLILGITGFLWLVVVSILASSVAHPADREPAGTDVLVLDGRQRFAASRAGVHRVTWLKTWFQTWFQT